MRIGNLGSSRRVDVGAGGVIHLDRSVTASFWIGADDRWHMPAAEITQRQSLVDDAPVVRTATRVPGGDVVFTTYATRQGRRDLVVTEIGNESRTPIAIAIVVVDSQGPSLRLEGASLLTGDRPLALLPRAPQFAVSAPDEADLLALLRAGSAAPPSPSAERSEAIAALLPVTHGTSVRVVFALDDDPLTAAPVLSALPAAEQVARGWEQQRAGAMRMQLPAPGIVADHRRLLAALLLHSDDPPQSVIERAALANALGSVGWPDRGAALLSGIEEGQGRRGGFDGGVATTATVAEAIIACDVDSLMTAVAGALEFVAKRTKNSPEWAAVLRTAALWLARHGEAEAARGARRAWESRGRPWPPPTLPGRPAPAVSIGAAFVPDDLPALFRRVREIREVIVKTDADGSIDLFPGFGNEWLGAPFEAHGVPVMGARISAAVRWHGERPALLWDVTQVGRGDVNSPAVRMTCHALDPKWASTEPHGEALLNG